MRATFLACAAGLLLAACSPSTTGSVTAQPVAPVLVQDSQTALNSYQAALGVADVALVGNPALKARIDALAAKAAPYVALAQQGVQMAGTAPSLGSLAAEMLLLGAPYVTAVANGAH